MDFFKMHGCGNDYVFLNCLEQVPSNLPALAKKLSDRHYGIGGDGIVLIEPSRFADFFMRIFNADGSEGKMCGNAIRCLARYVYEHHLSEKTDLTIDTRSGIRKTHLILPTQSSDYQVTVEMGHPSFLASHIPMITSHPTFLNETIYVSGTAYRASAISIGNPHLVIRGGKINELGPALSQSEQFPEGVNISCVEVENATTIHASIWERGSKATMSCGTAACACLLACYLCGLTKKEASVIQPGGTLRVRYDEGTQSLFLTGEAVYVYSGTISLS